MSNVKSICPACKAEIEEDSKFCPECGANIEDLKKAEELRKAEEARMADEAKRVQCEKKFCINCGAELATDSVFCPECGTNQNTGISYESDTKVDQPADKQQTQPSKAKIVQNNTNETSNASLSDEEELLMRAYITGTTDSSSTIHHYEHYKTVFTKCEKSGSKVGWNWGAFWLTGWNLLYRRSYLWGLVLILVCYFLGLYTNGIGGILMMLLPGMFADYFHYKRYKEKLVMAKTIHKDDLKSQIFYMAQNGGVNKGIIIINIVMWIILILVFVIAVMCGVYIKFFEPFEELLNVL